MIESTNEGGCYCGNVRYQFTGVTKHQTLCHCIDCRRVVGAHAVPWIIVELKDFKFTKQQPVFFESSPGVKRSFCQYCGTTLTYQEKDRPNDIDITTGSLDHPELFAPNKDVFINDKITWAETIDGEN